MSFKLDTPFMLFWQEHNNIAVGVGLPAYNLGEAQDMWRAETPEVHAEYAAKAEANKRRAEDERWGGCYVGPNGERG